MEQESHGIRARSEGRSKAAIARRKNNFCCNNLIDVVGREAIERAKVKVGEISMVGLWIERGGACFVMVSM